MKTVLKVSAAILLGIFVVWIGVFVCLGGPWSLRQALRFRRVVVSGDHKAIAHAAIEILRTQKTNQYFSDDQLTNLPSIIASMKPAYVGVAPGHMAIAFHGADMRLGFEIFDREDSWEFRSYGEQRPRVMLNIPKHEEKIPQTAIATQAPPRVLIFQQYTN